MKNKHKLSFLNEFLLILQFYNKQNLSYTFEFQNFGTYSNKYH